MNQIKSYILQFLLIASCSEPNRNHLQVKEYSYNDTILIASSDIFLSCSRVKTKYIVFYFPESPVVENTNSTSFGESLSKKYQIGQDCFISFFYWPGIRYDSSAFEINLYCSTPKEDCIASDVTEEGGQKISRIQCIDSNMLCMGFGSFDKRGYTFVKVEDYRSIPNNEKEAFATEFLSRFKKRDTIFHFSNTISGQLYTTRFDQCTGKAIGQVEVENYAGKGELFIAVEKEWYDRCIELHSIADCIIDDYFSGKGLKMITLVAPMPAKNTFERLATFIVRENTGVEPKDKRQVIYNFVDCIWINEAFAQKLYSAEDCERYHSFNGN